MPFALRLAPVTTDSCQSLLLFYRHSSAVFNNLKGTSQYVFTEPVCEISRLFRTLIHYGVEQGFTMMTSKGNAQKMHEDKYT